MLSLLNVGQINNPAGIAQLVEQRTENPRVTGSSPVPGIRLNPLRLSSLKGSLILLSNTCRGGFTYMLKYKRLYQ